MAVFQDLMIVTKAAFFQQPCLKAAPVPRLARKIK